MKYLSATEISKILGICYEDALALIKYSGVKYVKIGRMYRVEEKEFK